MERFSLGFKMKMPKGYCAKIYGRSGMTVKHGIHLAGGVSILEGPSVFVSKTHTDPAHMKSKSMTGSLK